MRTIISGLLAGLLVLGSLPSSANELELMAIAPDHVGMTVRKSPVLYYFISQATSLPTRFTLLDYRKTAPVAEIPLKSPTHPGFWAIRLTDYQIVLDEELQYRWFVAVIRDPGSRATDIVTGGMIELVDPHLIDYYGRQCDRDEVRFLLKAGIWYDGFACLNELIEANPDDRTLWRLREDLLKGSTGLVPLLSAR